MDLGRDPAFLTALIIRTDSKVVGPYFSFASLIGGWGGLESEHLYKDETLK